MLRTSSLVLAMLLTLVFVWLFRGHIGEAYTVLGATVVGWIVGNVYNPDRAKVRGIARARSGGTQDDQARLR